MVVSGEPELRCDLVHRGEHGDHNVSGMITTAQRLVSALPAVVAARPVARIGETGRRALVVPHDLRDTDQAAALAQAAFDAFGRLDTVVNNVGGTMPKAFLDTDVEYLEKAFHFNVSIAHALTRAAARGYLAYGTAKAGLAHWTRLTAADLAPAVRVNGVVVGSVMTSALECVAGVPEPMQQMEGNTPLGQPDLDLGLPDLVP